MRISDFCFRKAGLSFLILLITVLYPGKHIGAQSLPETLSGRWVIESCGDKDIKGGHIVFSEGNKYAFFKRYSDDTGAEVKGNYLFSRDKSYSRLRLCLGDCNLAGSEWTSTFSLVRLNDAGKLEIFFSSDGNYPDSFPDNKDTQGLYIFMKEKD